METSFAGNLDALAQWRGGMDRQLDGLAQLLSDHDLLDASGADMLQGARQRLASDRLVVAFVAEFSRGKSELINAIFFADTGRRILPATPGRTTMCPVELGYQSNEAPMLSLLPIDTRLQPHSMQELRGRSELWTHIRLDPGSPERLAHALGEVVRTKAVTIEEARALGFWDDSRPADNPIPVAEGLVEVPSWRHALINYPHPLLRRGLVVLDTPGLNAIGAEPELTLSLLPSAHAVVFILAADAGVSRSDLSIWRDHLGAQAMARYVVLNKIDTLADALLPASMVDKQIEGLRRSSARTLGVPPERVFALSARQALTARIEGHRAALLASRLPDFEAVLIDELLPQRRNMLQTVVLDAVIAVEARATRALADHRRQVAEQLLELRGLRGKSGAKVQMILKRVGTEATDFEKCAVRLGALHSVHTRMIAEAVAGLAGQRLQEDLAAMHTNAKRSMFNLGAKKAFVALCKGLRERLLTAGRRSAEIHAMLSASYKQLNSEFGFTLTLGNAPALERYVIDIDLLERNYSQYLGLSNALRLAEPRFMEQFRRMLMSKLRVIFEGAAGDVELWNQAASQQCDTQLRERRQSFARRQQVLGRIRAAAGELETRIAEIEAQDQRLREAQHRVQAAVVNLVEEAHAMPDGQATTQPMRLLDGAPNLKLVESRVHANAA